MKYRSKFFILLISISILSCKGQTSKDIKDIDPKTFSEKINQTPNAQVIDVRTPEEYKSEHIDKALNIDWLGDSFDTSVAKLDKSKPVFVYCKSGGRSAKASAKLAELGFTTIYNLQGGIMKWNAAGLSKPSDKIIGMSSQKYGDLLSSDKKVLIDFNAKWCAPCKKMAPYLDQMQKDLSDEVVIIRLDADENKTLINEMKIEELPTLLLYENRVLKWKHSGYISEEDLKKQLQ